MKGWLHSISLVSADVIEFQAAEASSFLDLSAVKYNRYSRQWENKEMVMQWTRPSEAMYCENIFDVIMEIKLIQKYTPYL